MNFLHFSKGMNLISGRQDIQSDNQAFFLSGTRTDTGFVLPDIQPDTGY
jgi:hypothetical protein